MATLKDKMALAAELFSRNEQPGESRAYGVATAASSDGTVSVNVGGETVTMPTVGAVRQGDEVIVQVQDSSPVAIGSRGWGDAVQEAIDEHSITLSYVWLDNYGRLRVTPEPREDNPTTGVTISATGVDIASSDYTSSLTDDGFTILDGSSRQVARLCTGTWSQGAIIKGRNGVWLSSYSNDFDAPLAEPVELYIAPTVQQDAEIVQLQHVGVVYFKAYSDSVSYGGPTSERVYPVATSSHLGPVKVGDGLSVSGAGLLSANVGVWSSVGVNSTLFPSGFSATRSVTAYKNDALRLLYIAAIYDTDGTAVNVPANSVICVLNDQTLRSSSTSNIGYGLRYSSSGLADWTARYYPHSSNYSGIKTPTWAFTATSVKFQALLPYSALGL